MFGEQHIERLIHSISHLASAIEARGGENNTNKILERIEETLRKIMATQADIDAALAKIDAATNKLAQNIQTIANLDQQISDEIDKFLASAPVGTVLTDAQVAALQTLASAAQVTSDAGDQQVAVLQAIAAKGAGNPVPVPVPPAPTPPPIG